MKNQKAFLITFTGVLIILALLGISGSASALHSSGEVVSAAALTGSVNSYPVSHVLVVPSAEFRHDGNIPDMGFFSFLGGYWVGETSANPCFMAPVYLPRVGTISEVWATIYDNDAGLDFWLNLYGSVKYFSHI